MHFQEWNKRGSAETPFGGWQVEVADICHQRCLPVVDKMCRHFSESITVVAIEVRRKTAPPFVAVKMWKKLRFHTPLFEFFFNLVDEEFFGFNDRDVDVPMCVPFNGPRNFIGNRL